MGRALLTLLFSLSLAACDLRTTQVASQGTGGGAGGQAAACQRYIDCFEKTGGTRSTLDKSYGPSGSCWTTGAAAATSCAETCVSALASLRASNPTVIECASGGQAVECQNYLACYEKVEGHMSGLDKTYGPSGTCWTTGTAMAVTGCTDACIKGLASLQATHPTVVECGGTPPLDGGICAESRPVKLVLLVDQSGSMCVTDPPGRQQTPGFCESIAPPSGVTEPARVRGLKKLLTTLASRPDVSVSLIPFEATVGNVYPPTGPTRFALPADPGLLAALSALQSQLGNATDFEGALHYALRLITDDLALEKSTDAGIARLAVTRYVVLLISDGTPFPRCSGNDALPTYASSLVPDGIWPDSPGASSVCNDADAGPTLTGFLPGTDRNQNAALLAKISQILALTNQGAAGIRFNTQLLFNAQRVAACGPICQDVYGIHPEVPAGQYPQAALTIARWTLNQMALRGGGTYAEALDDFGIAALPNTLSTFVLDPACP